MSECSKMGYQTWSEAHATLKNAQARRKRSKQSSWEKNIYRCPDCHLWHLTSRRKKEFY